MRSLPDDFDVESLVPSNPEHARELAQAIADAKKLDLPEAVLQDEIVRQYRKYLDDPENRRDLDIAVALNSSLPVHRIQRMVAAARTACDAQLQRDESRVWAEREKYALDELALPEDEMQTGLPRLDVLASQGYLPEGHTANEHAEPELRRVGPDEATPLDFTGLTDHRSTNSRSGSHRQTRSKSLVEGCSFGCSFSCFADERLNND